MQYITIIILCLGTLTSMEAAIADHQIEGAWLNERNQITIHIQESRQGIKVKRNDQHQWFTYQRIRESQFRDQEGNTYYQINEGTLEWESFDGNRTLRFHRNGDQRSGGYNDNYRSDDSYENDSRFRRQRDSYDAQKTWHRLSGVWINRTTGQRIHVKKKGKSIKVKGRRGGWKTFRRTRKEAFVDDHGNRYRIYRGGLEYTSPYGDLVMRFKRI
ncbi:MAG: hypothetical protein OEQ53_09880 [Saprospiraceae bacterium]|nr:hypothetical protein [Saprospiraceae bacterium]